MRIHTCTPAPLLTRDMPDHAFFSRDMGLTCYALRERGAESRVIMLDAPDVKVHPDVIRATLAQLEDPAWWRAHEADGVVLGAWASPKYTPIARAIKQSGAKVIVRCDSGVPYSQWQWGIRWAYYFNYWVQRYRGRSPVYSAAQAMVKTAAFYIPGVYEKRVVEHLCHADLILNETPDGVAWLKALLNRYGHHHIAARVSYVPHPVAGSMVCDGDPVKERRMLAVGRWDTPQKNAPMLIRVLGDVLQAHPEYTAHLFGNPTDPLTALLRNVPSAARDRIHVHGGVPNAELSKEYKRSRILFMPSRSEGSSVAGEEALAFGCTVVGSHHVACLRNFVSKNTGTLSRRYSARHMATALKTEILAWEEGLRNPAHTAALWAAEVSARTVADTIWNVCARRRG
jgi:glycosyltransferase involved in cell wall biosynthesis